LKKVAALAAVLLAACGRPDSPPKIEVGDAWARASMHGQSSAAAYLTIRNSGGPDRLKGVSSPVGRVAVHETSTSGGVMRMRPVAAVELPAGSTVNLRPGGTHIMLTGLNAPLAAGSRFPLRLDFQRSGTKDVQVEVRAPGEDGEHH
jgi:copper(I)-binding protein